jgi:7,8-dihydropterin-6-yl-methyl-4-(beta-D-ribofuranosyl)aminobenzene 5'-phosphate synthase
MKCTVLFDTGADGQALLFNIEKLGIRLEEIDCVFISHDDWDHRDGLETFIGARGNLPIYVPHSAADSIGQKIKGKAELIPVSGPKEIFPGFFSTGEMAGIEQSLIVETRRGNIVITGCTHPGLDRILETASKFGNIFGAIGGFHDFKDLNMIKNLKLIMPCHCTEAKEQISRDFPGASVQCRVGAVIEVE